MPEKPEPGATITINYGPMNYGPMINRRLLMQCLLAAGLPAPLAASDKPPVDLTDPGQLLTYYTDLDTGELLETFANPYTGETNKVQHVRLGPELRYQTSAGLARPANPLVKTYASNLGPAVVHGDDVWIPLDVEATIQFPKPTAPSIALNLYTTVHGRMSDALNPTLNSAPCELNFQNVLKWEPFLRMGDHPGHMMSRAAGRKLESVDDLPADYVAMAERMHGKYIADPIATLDTLSQR